MPEVTIKFNTIEEMPLAQACIELIRKADTDVKGHAVAPRAVDPIIEPKKEAPAKETKPTENSAAPLSGSKVTYVVMRNAVKAAKESHGSDAVFDALVGIGLKKESTLLKTIDGAGKDRFAEVVKTVEAIGGEIDATDAKANDTADQYKAEAVAEAAPETKKAVSMFDESDAAAAEETNDGLDDDDLDGDDLAETNIDPEAVKLALRAYSKSTGRDEARKIMTDAGAQTLSDVSDLPQDKLAAIIKAVS